MDQRLTDESLLIMTEYKSGKCHGIELYYTSDRKVGAAKHYVNDREMS